MIHCVAWDIYEHRPFGAPGQKEHHVLWVENYRRSDGTVSGDLDDVLEGYKNKATTIYVRPLYTEE